MKYLARSPTQKDQFQWVRVGHMLQDQGGLVPFAIRTRSIQALFVVILILVCTTLFMAVLTIGESISLKVRIGLAFNKPSRLHQPINLQQEAGSTTVEFDNDAQQQLHIDLRSSSNSLLVKASKGQLPTQQQQHLKESAKDKIDRHRTGNNNKKRNNKDITYTRRTNDLSGTDISERKQFDTLLGTSRSADGEIGLEDRVQKKTRHQESSNTSTPHHSSKRILDPKSESLKLSTVNDRVRDSPAAWLEFPDLYPDSCETEQVMLQIRQNGTLPCHDVRTRTAEVLGLPERRKVKKVGNQTVDRRIQLHAGPVYELLIVSIGDDDEPRCQGGDYYETDLSGPLWKSRPPVVDLHNGTYAVHLQMDPRFAGRYTFTVVLLFANFHALHFHPQIYARMEDVATFEIEFLVPDEIRNSRSPSKGGSKTSSNSGTSAAAPRGLDLPICRHEDFKKKHWSGRWTRENFNEDCEYDRYGLWRCVDPELQCQKPWCEGPVGSLESNGWVYSAHCAFKIFRKEEAWTCLDGKWLFFWGDSNHVDTIRNLLNFVLGFDNSIKSLDRRMDMTFSSPPDNRSSVRITSIFNGHSNVSLNYEGLYSLHDEEFATKLQSYFIGETAPDYMIMNSGLHDGLYWRNMDAFLEDGVEYAAQFWSDVWNNMTARRPDILYRTTVATGGQSRNMSFNPHKMELFNHIIVDKFVKMNLERFQIIDGFDYTFPWHWDHKTNDGVHYGRPPAKTKWAGNNIGHRYFVDLMLVHMLLNAICT